MGGRVAGWDAAILSRMRMICNSNWTPVPSAPAVSLAWRAGLSARRVSPYGAVGSSARAGSLGAVRTLHTMVIARIATTTPSDTTTGIL
jgi:hypothetical protein